MFLVASLITISVHMQTRLSTVGSTSSTRVWQSVETVSPLSGRARGLVPCRTQNHSTSARSTNSLPSDHVRVHSYFLYVKSIKWGVPATLIFYVFETLATKQTAICCTLSSHSMSSYTKSCGLSILYSIREGSRVCNSTCNSVLQLSCYWTDRYKSPHRDSVSASEW